MRTCMKNYLLLAVYSTTLFHSFHLSSIENDIEFANTESHAEINLKHPTTTISYPPLEPHYEAPPKTASPNVAALLSMLYPGLGHAYLGDMKTAGYLAGGATLATGTSVYGISIHDQTLFNSGSVISGNTWNYGVYAAYRDARMANGSSGYSYKMPQDSFIDLLSAPFRPSILKKPEVWAGTLGALLAASSVVYFAYAESSIQPRNLSASGASGLHPIVALPVGIGEEAFFRGYLQSQLCEMCHPVIGITLSSLIFGAAHIGNAMGLPRKDRNRYYAFSLPLISALGGYCGWLTHKNNSLKEAVAVHTLYDFALFSISAAAQEASIGEEKEFSISIPF